MSLAREMVAARCVTSSIAARTVDAPSTASIRKIAADGASSPTRHCTRVARIVGGCRPSVRRVMASASIPVRLLMSVRFEMGDHSSVDVDSLAQHAPVGPEPHTTTSRTEDDNAYTKSLRPPEIRQGSVKARRERHATEEKRNAQIRKERQDSEEPKAGDRHRPVRGAEKGREGPSSAHGTKGLRGQEAEPLTTRKRTSRTSRSPPLGMGPQLDM